MRPILEVKRLYKRYGKINAVDGISFTIAPSVCFGLLGPNGAGKTTTIEIIEKVIQPDAGTILYKGHPRSAGFLEEVGIQFQKTELLAFLTVRETLKTFQQLYRTAMDVDEVIGLCGLDDVSQQLNDKISGGQKQRLWLALALINQPKLLFLDEPSTGLDPHARLDLWQVIVRIKEKGRAIILTTHYMEEAEKLCDDIAIMNQGRIIAQGSPQALIATYCKGVTIMLPRGNLTPNIEKQFPIRRETDGHIALEVDDASRSLKKLMGEGIDLTDISIRTPNLEDVFLNLTGKHLLPSSEKSLDGQDNKIGAN